LLFTHLLIDDIFVRFSKKQEYPQKRCDHIRYFRIICAEITIIQWNMLIRFNVANFLSFKNDTEFNMLAAKALKTHKEHVYSLNRGLKILKASAIYGANGAGKSNLIKAINSFKEIVEQGFIPKKVNEKKNKLAKEGLNQPITHEIEFSIKNRIYTYGIVFDSNLCIEEWLYQTGVETSKMIFERTYSDKKQHPVLKMQESFLKTEKNRLLISLMEENLLQNNELLISKRENLKIKEINDVYNWFNENLIIIYPETKSTSIFSDTYSDNSFKDFAEKLLHGFDVGINNLSLKSDASEDLKYLLKSVGISFNEARIEKMKKEVDEGHIGLIEGEQYTISITKENEKYIIRRVVTTHRVNGNDVAFEIKEESDGTQRLFDFIPMIRSVLDKETTYLVDEIDRSLHPALLHSLIKKIMDNDSTLGQLIFTTHESSLLSCKIFRADEIWFAEKDKEDQCTHLYTLNEFKPRNDLDIEKGYLNGRFGAIPFLSRLDDLNWN